MSSLFRSPCLRHHLSGDAKRRVRVKVNCGSEKDAHSTSFFGAYFRHFAGTPPDRPRGRILDHHSIRANSHIVTNHDWPKYLSSRTDVTIVTDNRHLVVPTTPTDGHTLRNHAILPNLLTLMYHYADTLVAEACALANFTLSGNERVVHKIDPHLVQLCQRFELMGKKPMCPSLFVHRVHESAHLRPPFRPFSKSATSSSR